MNTKSTDDIDLEQWLAKMPAPPAAVCARLKAAGIRANWNLWHDEVRGGYITIESTFSKLPLIKQILTESGAKVRAWPQPLPWRKRQREFSFDVHYLAAGPEVLSHVSLTLIEAQQLKLDQYAQSLGQTQRVAAQALFNNALLTATEQGLRKLNKQDGPPPRRPVADEGDLDDQKNWDRYKTRENKGIVQAMRQEWPTAADWNVVDDDHVEILDKKDSVLAIITGEEASAYLD